MESIDNGLLLLLIGMSTVFVFLGVMVIAIELSSRVCARYAHLLPEKEAAPTRRKSAPRESDDNLLLAVIAAAVNRYRQEHRQ